MAVTEAAMAANLSESLMRLRGLVGTDRIILAEVDGSDDEQVNVTLDTGEQFQLQVTAV